MGLLDKLRDSLALPAVAAGSVAVPYESAWASPNHLLPIDPAPREDIRVSRATAMGVPALARARRLIVMVMPTGAVLSKKGVRGAVTFIAEN